MGPPIKKALDASRSAFSLPWKNCWKISRALAVLSSAAHGHSCLALPVSRAPQCLLPALSTVCGRARAGRLRVAGDHARRQVRGRLVNGIDRHTLCSLTQDHADARCDIPFEANSQSAAPAAGGCIEEVDACASGCGRIVGVTLRTTAVVSVAIRRRERGPCLQACHEVRVCNEGLAERGQVDHCLID